MNETRGKAAWEDREVAKAQLAGNKKEIALAKAHSLHELKPLIQDWLVFKLHMKFKKRDAGSKAIKRSIYGDEHSVTYDQCLYGKVDCIVLDRLQGYTRLIKYVEHDLKGQYIECKIYFDEKGDRSFSKLCRKYVKGSRVLAEDPALTEEDVKLLYYTVKMEKVFILEKKLEETPLLPDFKALVEEAVK